MKKLHILPALLMAAALLTTQALAAPAAELIRVFETDGTLYTYVSLTGSDSPITKAEAKLGQQSFPASGSLETVRQAGFPVEYLLLVDNSNSMPSFRREVSAFTAALAEESGENTTFTLAAFGDQFTLKGEELTAEMVNQGVAGIPMDETVTRLNSSIGQALDYLESIPRTGKQLRCMVVISDAVQYDPKGGVPYEKLVERLEHSDVMLHSVGLGADTDALERMSGLATASGGTHRNVSGPEEAAQAAQTLAQQNGDLLVAGFDISSYRSPGGEEPVSVTFASGAQLVCRGEGMVALSPAGEEGAAAPTAPAENPAQPLPPAQAQAPTAAPDSSPAEQSGPPIPAAAAGVTVLAAMAAAAVLILRRKRGRTAAVLAQVSPTVLSSVYLRLDVPEGAAVHGDLEWELTGEIALGNRPECDVVLGDLEAPVWRLRIFLHEGAVWCAPVAGPASVNGAPLQADQRMRSGDLVSCGGIAFRLKF